MGVVQLRVRHMVDMILELVLDPRVRIVVVRHGLNVLVVSVVQLRVRHVVHMIGKLMIDPCIRVVVVVLVVRMVSSVVIMLSMRFGICFMHFFSWVCVSVDVMRRSVSSVCVMIPRVEVSVGGVISDRSVCICVIVRSVVVWRVQL